MADRLRFHRRVVADLKQAISCYDKKLRLNWEIDFGRKSIHGSMRSRSDNISSRWHLPMFASLKCGGSPYLVLLQDRGDLTFILGIFHCASNPAKWRRRLQRKS